MPIVCAKCNNAIDKSKQLPCGGVCGQNFHFKCVNISDKLFGTISGSVNICWKCDSCAGIPGLSILRKLSDLTKVVNDLKNSMDALISGNNRNSNINWEPASVSIATVTDGIQVGPSHIGLQNSSIGKSASALSVNDAEMPGIRGETATSSFVVDLPPLDARSTSSKLTNKKGIKIIGTGSSIDSVDVIPRRRWIHVSRFKANASLTDHIVKHVSLKTVIPAGEIECYPLVKADVDLSTLQYLIDDIAPQNWPPGIVVKPFLSKKKTVLKS